MSVIVTCYNYGRYLGHALDSVSAQTFRDFELIVVNDGSTDDSERVAAAFIAANPQLSARLVNQENSGQPALARNRGIEEATGDLIVCLDADDMIGPMYLAEGVRTLARQPGVAIAYPEVMPFSDDHATRWPGTDYDAAELIQRNILPYCAMYRRRAWLDIGGYRTNVRGYEDWDFWIACAAGGHYGQRIPLPLLFYRSHGTGVYASTDSCDLRLRAQIVANNPSCYRAITVAWAHALLDEALTFDVDACRDVDGILVAGLVQFAQRSWADEFAEAAALKTSGELPRILPALHHLATEGVPDAAALRRVGICLVFSGDVASGLGYVFAAEGG